MWWCTQSQTEQGPTPRQPNTNLDPSTSLPAPWRDISGITCDCAQEASTTLRCPAGPACRLRGAACTAFFSGCSSDAWVGTVTGRAWFSGGELPSGNTPSRARALRPKCGKQKEDGWKFYKRVIPCKCHKSLYYHMQRDGWAFPQAEPEHQSSPPLIPHIYSAPDSDTRSFEKAGDTKALTTQDKRYKRTACLENHKWKFYRAPYS